MMIPLRTPLSKMASWRPALVRQSRLLFVVAVTAVSANSAVVGWNTAPETIEEHPAWIYTPSTAMPNGKHPFLIVLHGCAQTHTEIKEFGNGSNCRHCKPSAQLIQFDTCTPLY